MATNLASDTNGKGGFVQNAPSLYAADCLCMAAVACKQKSAAPVWEVQGERLNDLRVQGDNLLLACLALCDGDVGTESPSLKIVHIFPLEQKHIADS